MSSRGVLVALALLAAACASPARPFTDAFYEPIRVRAGGETTAVTVFAFVDDRGATAPTAVLEYESDRDVPRAAHATRSVGAGVAHAFARGLRARGFTVSDATHETYVEGQAIPRGVALTGRVTEFGARLTRSGTILQRSQQRVGCTVVAEVRDASGRRLFERPYSHVVEGAMMPAEPLAVLSQALAAAVEHAVTDPDLQAALR
jgi:hypothetical protein